jgi:hypothetical protein
MRGVSRLAGVDGAIVGPDADRTKLAHFQPPISASQISIFTKHHRCQRRPLPLQPHPGIYAHGATQSSSECILSENIEYIRHSQRAVAVQVYFPNHGTGSGMAVDDIPNRIVLGDCYAEQNSPQLLLSISSDHWVVLAYL